MKTSFPLSLAIGLAVSLAAGNLPAAQQAESNTADNGNSRLQEDTSSAIVQLHGAPLSAYLKTKPAQGKKIDFDSRTVKAYRALLNSRRNQFKKWLAANAPKANVTGKFDISLNAVSVALNGTSLDTLRKCTLVRSVQYQAYYYPTVDDPDLGLIKAIEAWQTGGGPANAGAEVKVAVIDTGIDIQHPCFTDAGYPNKTQIGDRRFTNNKVIAAKVFNNKAGNAGLTPQAVQSHGTHVAGTVACNYNTAATVDGVAIPFGISGVAPRALLGNYNIFPGPIASARSEDILNALEAAYEDGFDIANMSLGGRPKSGNLGVQDLVTVAVDNLDRANMIVAVASGNTGPGFDTVESPGSAARALTAGASTVPHYIATPVIVGSNSFGAASGEFTTVTNDLTAPLAVLTANGALDTACNPIAAGSLAGKIALLSRGTCSFSTKIRNAQAAGAVAVLVVNSVAGDPIAMGEDGTPNQPTIPAYMLSRTEGLSLVGSGGAVATIAATPAYFQTANPDFMAGFSSQGPTEVDFRVKPDVVAPGVNVLSSIPISFCGGKPCFAFFQGTSMSTPHLAGSAAVVRWLYPNWGAAEVRSAIVNTAEKNVLKQSTSTTLERSVNIIGAGRENLLAAVNAVVALDPVSVSFGAVPSGSGQSDSQVVTLRNISAGPATYSVSVAPSDTSVSYFVTPASVALSAGQVGQVTISMTSAKDAAEGNHQAWLSISSGTNEVAHAAVYTLIK
jgi:minor extracellular serine protease Vpr